MALYLRLRSSPRPTPKSGSTRGLRLICYGCTALSCGSSATTGIAPASFLFSTPLRLLTFIALNKTAKLRLTRIKLTKLTIMMVFLPESLSVFFRGLFSGLLGQLWTFIGLHILFFSTFIFLYSQVLGFPSFLCSLMRMDRLWSRNSLDRAYTCLNPCFCTAWSCRIHCGRLHFCLANTGCHSISCSLPSGLWVVGFGLFP